MRILNVRRGFACNSSSTHSVIFTKDRLTDSSCEEGFGCQPFVAASAEAKMRWLAATIYANLQNAGDAVAATVAKAWTGQYDADDYVDHQSLLLLPREWHGDGLNKEFIDELKKWLLDPELVLVGGNDNEDAWGEANLSKPKGAEVLYRRALPVDGRPAPLVARRDESGYWTLFDRADGMKHRVTFDRKLVIEAKRASAPELVDMKITDFCPYGCEFCYQGSTTHGGHADADKVCAVLRELAGLQVFEVAIGGGEPTLHPKFDEIIHTARYSNVVPNITTRDPRWFLRYPKLLHEIGAFAVSCDDVGAVQTLGESLGMLDHATRGGLKGRVVVQHVLGVADEWAVPQILSAARTIDAPVVLLGYKTAGRGKSLKPKVPAHGTWGALIAKLYADKRQEQYLPWQLGVDTVLAKEFKGEVPDNRLTLREGQFSCYIDAVNMKLHASSFSKDEGVPVEPYKDAIGNAWRKITDYEPSSAYCYR